MLNFLCFVYSCLTLNRTVIFTFLYQKILTTLTDKNDSWYQRKQIIEYSFQNRNYFYLVLFAFNVTFSLGGRPIIAATVWEAHENEEAARMAIGGFGENTIISKQ